jgi:Terminase RNaseH-like domain
MMVHKSSAQRQSTFTLALDVGQTQDVTAVAVLERVLEPLNEWTTDFQQKTATFFHVRHLERLSRGTPYPAMVIRAQQLLSSGPLEKQQTALVVDATGVGQPVIDLFRQAKLNPRAVTLTGGEQESMRGLDYRVPKRDLVSMLQIAFQNGKLKIAGGLSEAELLIKELLHLKVKVTAATTDSDEVWREGQHDDLVFATALALWWAERQDRYRIGTAKITGV